jgi:DNA replication protein DnaC
MSDLANLDYVDAFCRELSGELGEKMRAAAQRRKDKIAQIGYPAYKAEMDAKKQRMMEESNMGVQIKRAEMLLEKAEKQELTKEEQQILLSASAEIRSRYIILMLRQSGLGKKFFTRTFFTFRATPNNEVALNACIDLLEGRRTKGVILSGSHGIGKTHLAAAVVNGYAEKGKKASFANFVHFVKKVQDSFKTGTEPVIRDLIDSELLVIDDLGAEHTKIDSGWIDSILYEILNSAYEADLPVIVTSNLTDYDLARRYNTRIVSRLHEMCDWISYEDYDARMDMEPTDEVMPFV